MADQTNTTPQNPNTNALNTSGTNSGGVNLTVKTATPGYPPNLNIKADPRKEYVSSGAYTFLTANFLKSQPQYIDDLEKDFGISIYESMMKDAKIKSLINLVKLAILGNGLKLTPKVTDDRKPGFEESQQLLEFVQRNFDRLQAPIRTTLRQMLDALWLGYTVTEKVFEYCEEGQDAGLLCLKALKVKPRKTTAFVIDAFYNVVALLGLLPGMPYSTTLLQNYIGIPASGGQNSQTVKNAPKILPPNLLPADKFIIYSNEPRYDDPRGTSMLRPAYYAWWCKQQTINEYLKFLAQYAVPSLAAVLPPDAQQVVVTDSFGNVVTNEDGTPMTISAAQNLLNILLDFRNGASIVVPNGTDVKPIQVAGDGAAFLNALEYWNGEMVQAVLIQKLATETAQFQTNASTGSQQDILDKLILDKKQDLIALLTQELVKPLIVMNFGLEAWELYGPTLSINETESQDLSKMLVAVGGAVRDGFLDASQFAKLDAMLGLPVRDMDSISQAQQQQQDNQSNQDSPDNQDNQDSQQQDDNQQRQTQDKEADYVRFE